MIDALKNVVKGFFLLPVKALKVMQPSPHISGFTQADYLADEMVRSTVETWLDTVAISPPPSSADCLANIGYFYKLGKLHAIDALREKKRSFLFHSLIGLGIAGGVAFVTYRCFKKKPNFPDFSSPSILQPKDLPQTFSSPTANPLVPVSPSPENSNRFSFLRDFFGKVESRYKSTQLAVGTAISQMPFWQVALFSTLGLIILGISITLYNQRKKVHEKQKTLLESTLFDDLDVSAIKVIDTN